MLSNRRALRFRHFQSTADALLSPICAVRLAYSWFNIKAVLFGSPTPFPLSFFVEGFVGGSKKWHLACALLLPPELEPPYKDSADVQYSMCSLLWRSLSKMFQFALFYSNRNSLSSLTSLKDNCQYQSFQKKVEHQSIFSMSNLIFLVQFKYQPKTLAADERYPRSFPKLW